MGKDKPDKNYFDGFIDGVALMFIIMVLIYMIS